MNRHNITVFSEISCPDQFRTGTRGIQIMTSDTVLQVEPMQSWNLPTPPLCCCHVVGFFFGGGCFCFFVCFRGLFCVSNLLFFPAILSTSLLLNIHWFVHHSFISSFLRSYRHVTLLDVTIIPLLKATTHFTYLYSHGYLCIIICLFIIN